jgi:outer membrane protein
VLLSREQASIAEIQLAQSQAQLINTRKLVDAGSLPELNAAELEAQVARDSSNVITAKGTITQNLLSLKAYLGIEADQPFDIDSPKADAIPLLAIAELQPDIVYQSALANQPQQRYNDFKMKAAEKLENVARADLKPTISAFGSLGSGYANYFNIKQYKTIVTTGPTGLKADAGGGVLYDVIGPNYIQVPDGKFKSKAFFTQLSDNFRQSIGLNISVPIFNGWSLRNNYERSKIVIKDWGYQKMIADQKLKQDIYTAYNNAVVALEKFNAGKKSLETAERSYTFAKKRYDIGLSNTIELITNQNNLFTQKLQYALNQFDYVFKMKVLEFYRGQGLKF